MLELLRPQSSLTTPPVKERQETMQTGQVAAENKEDTAQSFTPVVPGRTDASNNTADEGGSAEQAGGVVFIQTLPEAYAQLTYENLASGALKELAGHKTTATEDVQIAGQQATARRGNGNTVPLPQQAIIGLKTSADAGGNKNPMLESASSQQSSPEQNTIVADQQLRAALKLGIKSMPEQLDIDLTQKQIDGLSKEELNKLTSALQSKDFEGAKKLLMENLTLGNGSDAQAQKNTKEQAVTALLHKLGKLPAMEFSDTKTAFHLSNSATSASAAVSAEKVASASIGASLFSRSFAPELAERIQWMVGQKIQSASIRIEPAELGPINVKINHNNGEAQIQFLVQHAQTRESMEQSLAKLREMLTQNGINLSDVNVQQESKGSFNQSQTEQGGEVADSQSLNQPSKADAEADELGPTSQIRNNGLSVIDTYA